MLKRSGINGWGDFGAAPGKECLRPGGASIWGASRAGYPQISQITADGEEGVGWNLPFFPASADYLSGIGYRRGSANGDPFADGFADVQTSPVVCSGVCHDANGASRAVRPRHGDRIADQRSVQKAQCSGGAQKAPEGASPGASGVCAGRGVALSRGIDPLSLREGGMKLITASDCP